MYNVICCAHRQSAEPQALGGYLHRARGFLMAMIISQQLRDRLIEQSGSKCSICGQQFPASLLEIAHISPISQGGTNDIENLMVICPNCHFRLDNTSRPLREYELGVFHLS